MRSQCIWPPAIREATAQQAVIAAETLAIDVERHLHNWEVDQLVDLVDNEVEEIAKGPLPFSYSGIKKRETYVNKYVIS